MDWSALFTFEYATYALGVICVVLFIILLVVSAKLRALKDAHETLSIEDSDKAKMNAKQKNEIAQLNEALTGARDAQDGAEKRVAEIEAREAKIVADAQAKADALVGEATAAAAALNAEATAQSESMVAEAKAMAEQLTEQANKTHQAATESAEKMLSDAERRAESMVSVAQRNVTELLRAAIAKIDRGEAE